MLVLPSARPKSRIYFLNVGRGDCTIIQFPSGRVAVVDIDNLRVLDPETRDEAVADYRSTASYQLAKARGEPLHLLEQQFLQKEEEKLTDPLAYYDIHVGKDTDIFRLIVTSLQTLEAA